MTPPEFVTLADGLIGAAEAVEGYFDGLGYTVKREPAVLEYPYTPTLRCTRQRTTLVVEVDSVLRVDRLEQWTRYGHSCNRDFRVAVALPLDLRRHDSEAENAVRALGVGIYTVGGEIVELHMPHDLSISVNLPDLVSMPRRMRQALGPMYEQFQRSHWREGFEDGCEAFSRECRTYMKKHMASGRLVVIDKVGRPRRLTDTNIDRMTMGQLAVAFSNIQTPNYVDTTLASVLTKVNPQRVGVVHHKVQPQTEAKLRKNVGQNVWLLFAGMKALFDVK